MSAKSGRSPFDAQRPRPHFGPAQQSPYQTARSQSGGWAFTRGHQRDIPNKYTLYKIPMPPASFEQAPPPPPPHPDSYDGRHDGHPDYVLMPSFSEAGNESFWRKIKNKIFGPWQPSTVEDFAECVKRYNPDAERGTQGFSGLHTSLTKFMSREDQRRFFDTDIKDIMKMGMRLKEVVTSAPPLLKAGRNASVSLSQHQAASLLANAFMCRFPGRNGTQTSSGMHSFPDFNFDRLFEYVPDERRARLKAEKLKCILNYFRRVATTPANGVLTITRRTIEAKSGDWWKGRKTALLENVDVSSEGCIEDAAEIVQIDFANKYIGGGVLGNGLVQEEIRFLQFPEMIVTRLLCERMNDDEAILVIGAEKFNETAGYSSTFKWVGNFSDHTPWDEFRRRRSQVVAMDALDFSHHPEAQYEMKNILRELNKARAGFSQFSVESTMGGDHLDGIATGNWGCGAFKGDPRLKFLIQLMAVSEASRRRMNYYTHKDKALAMDLHKMHRTLVEKSVSVGELFSMLERYSQEVQKKHVPLFTFLSTSTRLGSNINDDGKWQDKEESSQGYPSGGPAPKKAKL